MPLFVLGILGALGAIGTGLAAGAKTAATAVGTFAKAALDFGGAVFEGVGGVGGVLGIAKDIAPLFINPLVNVNEQAQLGELGTPIGVPIGAPGTGFIPGGVAGPLPASPRPGGGFLEASSFMPGGASIEPLRDFMTPGDRSMGLIGQIQDFLGSGTPALSLGPSAAGNGCAQLFTSRAATVARPQRTIVAVNPVTGKPEFWEHKGRPVLYTSDLRAAKRVRKIASKARSASRSGR